MKFSLWARFRLSLRARKDLDQLLINVPRPQSALRERTSWFFDLLEWIRHEGLLRHEADFKSGAPQAGRVRYLLNVLDRNHDWKRKVAGLLRSLLRDTHGLDLFLETGLASQSSLGGELLDRLQSQFLPVVPRENDLAYLFQQNFHSEEDLKWIQQLDAVTLRRLEELFQFNFENAEGEWNTLRQDAEKALLLLSAQVQGLGLSKQIRQRISEKDFSKVSFYQLTKLVDRFVHEPDPELKSVLGSRIEQRIEDCFATISEVQHHLDEFGVNIQIVFQMERLESLLRRMRSLNTILLQTHLDSSTLSTFLTSLISDNLERLEIKSLLSQSFSLLARKITERSAESGEHYITRTPKQYFEMIKMALGGGFVTSFTTIIKFIIYSVGFPSFYAGFLSGLNYAISFLVIHFAHFTLATKQSSMTAPALAAKLPAIRDPKSLEELVDEILNLVRSQVAAIWGNVIGVIPMTVFICWVVELITGHKALSQATALKVMNDYSILGPTPLYAIFTGVLLWASSVIAGWADNWFAYHRLSPAIAQNRRLIFVVGELRARAFALFLKRNVVGIAGTVSLGFLLGLAPTIFTFLGVSTEVRHVTLSTGSLAAAMTSLSPIFFRSAGFWLAILGIVSMAALNVLVPFYLAFVLAIRARRIQAPERELIYQAVLRRLRQNPRALFWPSSKKDDD